MPEVDIGKSLASTLSLFLVRLPRWNEDSRLLHSGFAALLSQGNEFFIVALHTFCGLLGKPVLTDRTPTPIEVPHAAATISAYLKAALLSFLEQASLLW